MWVSDISHEVITDCETVLIYRGICGLRKVLESSGNRPEKGRFADICGLVGSVAAIHINPLFQKAAIMIRSRKIHIPGVGGPIVETTIDAPFEGASRQIGLELGPGYRPEPDRAVITPISIALISFLTGFLIGVVAPLVA